MINVRTLPLWFVDRLSHLCPPVPVCLLSDLLQMVAIHRLKNITDAQSLVCEN